MVKLELQHFIDGQWSSSVSGGVLEVQNPADGSVVGSAMLGTRQDVQRALETAHAAFEPWKNHTGDERATILKQAARDVASQREELARLLTSEHGKPLADARKEIDGAAGTLEFYAEEARRITGDLAPAKSATSRSLVLRQPVGVVAAIAPWNYPVSLTAWKIAPALAAGCTVVAKPPRNAPLATTRFCAIVAQAGLPNGALNVVTGDSGTVGEELITNPLTRMIAFTGSTEVGRHLMRQAATDLKKLVLELGGHTALVVFKDADPDRAVADSVKRSFRNMGQICNAVNRIYVEEEIAEAFLERFKALTAELTIGNGLENPNVDLGPMIDAEGVERTKRHVDDALAKGATLLCGGAQPAGDAYAAGFFYEPTALSNVTPDMLVMHEETFGPVVGISTFRGLDEAVALTNSTDYGLVTYAYTQDLRTAFLFGERTESGSVAINSVSPDSLHAPYPAWKQSGIGLELSHYGLEEYLQVKHLLIELA